MRACKSSCRLQILLELNSERSALGQIVVTFKRVCKECGCEETSGGSTRTYPGPGLPHSFSRLGVDTRLVPCKQCGQVMQLFVAAEILCDCASRLNPTSL